MLKRLVDIIIALSALILLMPVFLIVIYKVRKNLGSPVFSYKNVRAKMVNYLK